MLSEPIRPGDPNLAERCEELRRELLRLGNVAGGPGIRVVSAVGGLAISAIRGEETRGRSESCGGGTPKVLAQTQGSQDTDTWDRSVDNCPVHVPRLTDIKYDTTTHKITFRVRLDAYDRCGKLLSVGAEGALIEVTTAEACT